MKSPLRSRFMRFVKAKRLIAPGDRVLAAVSGGVDSMVLLHLLKESANDLQIEVTAAHFDHAMREASAEDAVWLDGVCDVWNVPLTTERSRAPLHGETAARAARYEFLQRAQLQADAHKIATGHHADDQIETVLFRLMRGTGLRGLSGIPMRRGTIIRPLLPFKRIEIEAYAEEHSIAFRLDETNATDLYARNRIRRSVIPAMQTVQPSSPDAILALARHAAQTEQAWRTLMRNVRKNVVLQRENSAIELARDKLLEYDGDIRGRLLRSVLQRLNSAPDRDATAALLQFVESAQSGASFDVAGGVLVERAYNVIRIARSTETDSDRTVDLVECGEGSSEAVIGGRTWSVEWTTSHEPKPEGSTFAAFDCNELRFPLTIRAWRPGDRIRMQYGRKKLKKLFAEQRVPFNLRASLPLLTDAGGRVLWIPNVARAADAPVIDDNPALTITVSNAENS